MYQVESWYAGDLDRDLRDNSDLDRIANSTQRDLDRVAKYHRAIASI